MKIKKRIELGTLILWIEATALVFLATFFVWGVRRGFDIVDEGYYYEEFINPAAKLESWGFQYYGSFFYHLFSGSIFIQRILTGLSILLPSLGLGLATKKSGETGRYSSIFLILIYSFLAFTFGPLGLSYNFQSAALLLVSASLFVTLFSDVPKAKATILLAGMGFCSGMTVFSKWPTALIMLGVAVLSAVLYGKPVKEKMRLVGIVLAGALIALCFHFLFLQSISQWWSDFKGSFKSDVDANYHILNMLFVYLVEIKTIVIRALVKIKFSLILLFLGFIFRRHLRKEQDLKLFNLTLLITVLELGLTLWMDPNTYEDMFAFHTAIVIWLIAALFVQNRSRPQPYKISNTLIFVLLVVPFAGSIGTTNHIYHNALFAISAWGAAIVILLDRFPVEKRTSVLSLQLIGVVGILMQYHHFFIEQPWGLGGQSRRQQTELVEIGPDHSQLLVSPEIKKFLEEIRKSLGSDRDRPVVALFNMPGIIFALNKNSTGPCWYYSLKVDQSRNISEFKNLDKQQLRSSNILVQDFGHPDWVKNLFETSGVSFPEEFERVSSVWSPYTDLNVEIWRPKSTDD